MAKEPPRLDSGGEHPTQYGERVEPPRQDGKRGTDPSERSETGLSQRFPEKHVLDSGGEHDTRVDPLSKFLEEGRELPPELEREHRAVLLRPRQLVAKRFEVVEMLGFGGMGAVYKVKDQALGTDCALKIMLPSLLGSETARQRFYSEVRISQELAHDGIVRVHNLAKDEERGLEFFVMEFVEGKTLHRLLNERGGKLPVREALDIILEVCDALEYAHRRTIHRDLKPQNIMVQPDGRIKVLDFGLAKLMSPGRLTKSSMALGTAYYQAPEQSVHLRELDQRADIYSLGVVFYQLLTGKIPLGRVKPPSTIASGVPRALDGIVLRCLESESEDRYPDVAALRTAITEAARPKRRKWPMAVVGIAVLACVFGAVFGMRVIRENAVQPPSAGEQSVVPQFVVPPSGGLEPATPSPELSAPDRLKPELPTPERQEEGLKTASEASEAKIAAMAAQQAARDAKAEEYALEDFNAGAELLKDGDAHDRLKAFDEAVAKCTAASEAFANAEAKAKGIAKEIADLEQARTACAKAKAEADGLGASEWAKARYEQALEQEEAAKAVEGRVEAAKALGESAALYALAAQEARAQGDAIVTAAKKAAEEARAKADTRDVKEYAVEERKDAEGLMAKAVAEKDFTKAKGLYDQAAAKYADAVRVAPDRKLMAEEKKAAAKKAAYAARLEAASAMAKLGDDERKFAKEEIGKGDAAWQAAEAAGEDYEKAKSSYASAREWYVKAVAETPVTKEAAEKPKTRFTVSSEGLITDSQTGLEWVVVPDGGTSYEEAKKRVGACNIAGGGWRMPTREELRALYQPGVGTRNMDPAFKTANWWVWAEPRDSSFAWTFNFKDGNDTCTTRTHVAALVFAVRSRSRR